MNIIDALEQRQSIRAFLHREVEEEKISAILSAASHAPSGANIQPWQVAIVSGETKRDLQQHLERQFRDGERGNADYQYYPQQWQEPYNRRRIRCGQNS